MWAAVTTYQFNPPPGRYYVVVQAYNSAGELSDKSAEEVVDVLPGGPIAGVQPPFGNQPPVSNQPPAPGAPPVAGQPPPPGPPAATPRPLRLVQPSNQTTKVNTSVVLAVSARHLDNKAFTFSATGLPPGLSINSGSGIISGTPHTLGFYRVVVTVSDGAFSASGDFTWSVVNTSPGPARPNQPPALAQPEDRKSPLDGTVAYPLSAIDPEGSPLTFTADGLPPGLSIDRSSGLISGTATTLGLYQVTVTASDGELSTAFSFRWAVVDVNTLEATNGKTDSSATSKRASEADGDTVTDPPGQDYVDVSGDFDGDGRNDLATYRLSSSEWRIWTSGSNFAKPTVMVWGAAGDRPVAADYNGDRVTDFAVYRPSTGTWHLSLSGTQTPLAVQWGGPEDVPVPLDHDGDGKADLALIRNGGYEILLSSANYLKSVQVH